MIATQEYYRLFPVRWDAPDREQIVESAIADARHDLKPLSDRYQVFEIRGKAIPADRVSDYGRHFSSKAQQVADWAIAWYALPAPDKCPKGYEDSGMQQEPLVRYRIEEAEIDEINGYLLIARMKVEP